MKHGMRSTYQGGCRCEECREANRDYQRALYRRRRPPRRGIDRALLAEALREIAPFGLTDDCPLAPLRHREAA